MHDIVPLAGCSVAVPEPAARVEPAGIYAALLADAGKPTTRRARESDVRGLCRFLNEPSPERACFLLVTGGRGPANAVVTAWRKSLLDQARSPAHVNRCMSTLRRLVRLARRFELVEWDVDVEQLPAQKYRDTSGPGKRNLEKLFAYARSQRHTLMGARDWYVLGCCYALGLRRSEVVGLDFEHWEPDRERVKVTGKGRYESEYVDVDARVCEVLDRWLRFRGSHPGPMLTRLDNASKHTGAARLSASALNELTKALGRRAGLRRALTPHALRHQAITDALELTNGNKSLAQRFGRHSDPKTTDRYDDNRQSGALEIVRRLSEKFD